MLFSVAASFASGLSKHKNGLGQINLLLYQVHLSVPLMPIATMTSSKEVTAVSVHCVFGGAWSALFSMGEMHYVPFMLWYLYWWVRGRQIAVISLNHRFSHVRLQWCVFKNIKQKYVNENSKKLSFHNHGTGILISLLHGF